MLRVLTPKELLSARGTDDETPTRQQTSQSLPAGKLKAQDMMMTMVVSITSIGYMMKRKLSDVRMSAFPHIPYAPTVITRNTHLPAWVTMPNLAALGQAIWALGLYLLGLRRDRP